MLKELLEFILAKTEPNYREHNGLTYSDRALHQLPEKSPEMIQTTTLNSIVDYIKNEIDFSSDEFSPANNYIIHIVGPRQVNLISDVKNDGKRWVRVQANAMTDTVPIGKYLDIENFNIVLQSMFAQIGDREKILSTVCNINDGAVKNFSDDGITQTINIKAGISRVGLEPVPNPVLLAPFRTFTEVSQPQSPFVLRLKSNEGELPLAALFEADNSMWKLSAMNNIKEFFEKELLDFEGYTLIM